MDRGIQVERVVWWVMMDRGRGGLAIMEGGEERVGEVIAAVGGADELRRSAQRRRTGALPPPVSRSGGRMGSTSSQVPLQIQILTHQEDA